MWKFIEIGDVLAYRDEDIEIKILNIYVYDGTTKVVYEWVPDGVPLDVPIITDLDSFHYGFYGRTYKKVGRDAVVVQS